MRKFLVVLDDSRECLNAMRFAAMRAAKTGGGVEILSVIPPDEFNHWIGVGEVMREGQLDVRVPGIDPVTLDLHRLRAGWSGALREALR